MLRKLVTSVPLKRVIRTPTLSSFMSTQQEAQPTPKLPHYRTTENDPINHTVLDLAKFYTVPPNVYNKILINHGVRRHYQKIIHLIGECGLMVRQPALTIMDYLEKANYSTPPNTYMLYGALGMGKTSTMAHLLHYCYNQKWLIVFYHDVFKHVVNPDEITPSTINPNLKDTPKVSAQWLQIFLNINGPLLETLQLQTTQKYEWSQREVTEMGAPLTELIDMGIKRPIYSSECIRVLLREITTHSASRRFRTLVAIDGVNHFYGSTSVKKLKRKQIECSKLAIVDAFLELLRGKKLQNGALLLSVDNYHFNPECRRPDYSPMYLLGEKGMEDIEPFLPVQVNKFTDEEFNHYLDYLCDLKWIQHPQVKTQAGREELKFLSGSCGGQLDDIVTPL